MKTLALTIGLLAAGCTQPAEDCTGTFDGRYAVESGPGDFVEIVTTPRYWESVGATFDPVYGPGCATMTGGVIQRGDVVSTYDLERTPDGLAGSIGGVDVVLVR